MTSEKLTRDEKGKAWAAAFILLAVLAGGWLIIANVLPRFASDPITAAIYRVEAFERVEIGPDVLPKGTSLATISEIFRNAGYELWATYRADDPLHDFMLRDGWTHTFSRAGGRNLFCGERLFVDIGMVDDKLIKAQGQSHWTCL